MTLIKVALKNLLRKRIRSIAIIIAAVLASACIFGATMIFYAMKKSVTTGMQKLGADILVIPSANAEAAKKILLSAEPANFYMDGKNLDKVREIKGVQIATPQIIIGSTAFSCCNMSGALLVGYDPKTDFTVKPWETLHYPPWVGHENLDPVTIGWKLILTDNKSLRFYGKQFRLGALLSPTGLGFMDNAIFMPMDSIRDMIVVSRTKSIQGLNISPTEISSILVKVGNEDDIHKVAKDIETAIPSVKTIITKDLIQDVRKALEAAVWGVMAIGILMWLMMLALMGLVFSMTVNERSREIGILRAMGATRGHVFQLLISEASILSGVGALAGIGLSLSLIITFSKLIIRSLGNIAFLWPSPGYIGFIGVMCFLFIVISGAASALYPAIKTSLKQPYDAIHEGM